MMRKVLVVIGTTGVGKTKLSIDLAKAVNGEIINSDAMQMYRGLDIATAKVTADEKEGIPHHLLDIVDPKDKANVLDYKRQALATIEDVLARGKTPIIVGGTMYYTQSILWNAQLMDDNDASMLGLDASSLPPRDELQLRKWRQELQQMDAQAKYDQLVQVDPSMAARLHVNNVRKVHRSLQVFIETGVPHSKWIDAQKNHQRNQTPRFDACALWVHCAKPVLDTRLATRVDSMVKNGLVDEIRLLYEQVKPVDREAAAVAATSVSSQEEDEDESSGGLRSTADDSVGILQAIGFKEFYPLLQAMENAQPGELTSDQYDHIMNSCIEQLNIATRQYARRQLSWIRNHFVPRNIPVYQFDSSDVSKWPETVSSPAVAIAQRFLRDEPIGEQDECKFRVPQQQQQQQQRRQADSESTKVHWQQNVCEICGNRQFVTLEQWNAHLKSKKHRFHLKRVAIEQQQQQQHKSQAEPTEQSAPPTHSCSSW